jgi:hypothetical protein
LDLIKQFYLIKFEEYIKILYISALAIYNAQKKMNFVHWDLTPWNIILKREEKEVELNYIISENKIYSIKSNIIPIFVFLTSKFFSLYKKYLFKNK